MRIWSVHPKYLDTKGLLAVWRESLLAKHVLEGKTKGYKNHPQLTRFKQMKNPLHAINHYLFGIYKEAESRNYRFDESKIGDFQPVEMTVTSGQLAYERKHLLNKLQIRNTARFDRLHRIEILQPAPLFLVIEGNIEKWERPFWENNRNNSRRGGIKPFSKYFESLRECPLPLCCHTGYVLVPFECSSIKICFHTNVLSVHHCCHFCRICI